MDSDGGSHAALDTYTRGSPPFLQHQFFPGSRVRENLNGVKQTSLSSRLNGGEASNSASSSQGMREHLQYVDNRREWDVKTWDWNSVLFLAQPTAQGATAGDESRSRVGFENGIRLHSIGLTLDSSSNSPQQTANGSSDHEDNYYSGQRRKNYFGQENSQPSISEATKSFLRDGSSPEEDGESLSLKLGGHSYAYTEDTGNGSRGFKRYRSSSPGPQFPMCQVDDCKADLSHAKDYHRRHKVCEMHSKAAKAPVSRLMQRFCQQCSRFHPLTEFDEGKRSCRRRLAGHNRRRRKTQPDTATTQGYLVGEDDQAGKGSSLVSILNVLAQLQAVQSVGGPNGVINDRDALLQYLQAGSSAATGLENLSAASLASLLNLSGVGSVETRADLKSRATTSNGHGQNSASETEALISALAGAKSAEALSLLLQASLRGHLSSTMLKVPESSLSHQKQTSGRGPLPTVSCVQVSDKEVEHSNTVSALPLLSSPVITRIQGGLPLSSPAGPTAPLQHGLGDNNVHQIDLPPTAEVSKGQVSIVSAVPQKTILPPAVKCRSITPDGHRGADAAVESTSDVEATASRTIFSEGKDWQTLQETASNHVQSACTLQPPAAQQTSDNSQSGSDQSPSSSDAEWQDRTGRISFKLFDRNPGELPQLLRAQILEWLAHRPSDMESYIRPGCVILTIFIAMPKSAWEELERDLRSSLQKLMACSEFWTVGRIHVQVAQQAAIIVDGKVHVSKPSKLRSVPQLTSVRPLAVVAGQKTQIRLKGCNLNSSGTRIFCVYQGKYTLEDGPWLEQHPVSLPIDLGETQEKCFSFSGGLSNAVGRCFIEVERLSSAGGNVLPVIVADGALCAELQMLEQEIETVCEDAANEASRIGLSPDEVSHQTDTVRRALETEVTDFLHELGWILQRTQTPIQASSFKVGRLNHLLFYAVERDWCTLVKRLLDILFEFSFISFDDICSEHLKVFRDDMSLLHRAVRRNCRPMVEMLLAYIPSSGVDEVTFHKFHQALQRRGHHRSIFIPDMPGLGMSTPLHIAASMKDAGGLIDALTSDPHQVGINAWINAYNADGESPFSCALANGNVVYVQMIRTKLAKRDGHLVVRIDSQKNLAPNRLNSANNSIKSGTVEKLVELPVWLSKSSYHKENRSSGKIPIYPSACSKQLPSTMKGFRGSLSRPFVLSLVAIAAICVCVCLVLKDPPCVFVLSPFSWRYVRSGLK